MDTGQVLLTLAIIIGSFCVLLALGLPVAFAFTLINVVGVFLLWNGQVGLRQLVLSIYSAVSNWALIPVPMFMLMGEVMFRSGVAPGMIDAVDKWLGKVPGRLSILATVGGTLFATCSGSSMASVALLGTTLAPEMQRRGYAKSMIFGPIIAAGGLDVLIPPSAITVIYCSLAQISVGKVLIGTLIPGLILAVFIGAYVIIRCSLQPSIAPVYETPHIPLSEKIKSSMFNIVPLALIIFMVLGVIFVGVASATEASALGALATFLVAAMNKKLNWAVIKESARTTGEIASMLLMIFTGSIAFSQILAFSGATGGVVKIVTETMKDTNPLVMLIAMQVLVLIMGCFLDAVSIMMITIPIFIPIANVLHFDLVWFAATMLLNLEIGGMTPPFGLNLFVMKGVAPPGTSMIEIITSVIPYLILNLVTMVLMIAFPILVLWLPGKMFT